MFSDSEIEYLQSQRLGRIATVSTSLQPDVAPVMFEFDGEAFYIFGLQQEKTHKYKNVASGNSKVALVIDDLASVDPLEPRGIKIHGLAEIVERPVAYGSPLHLKVTPEKYWSWGIEAPAFQEGQPIMKTKTRGQTARSLFR